MIIDGKELATEILEKVASTVAQAAPAPQLTIISCAPNFETRKYLNLKKEKAVEVGIETTVVEVSADKTTDDVIEVVKESSDQCDGLVVQLPLPSHIDTDRVLAHVPAAVDVDAIHYDGEGSVLPPVVGAIAAIAEKHDVYFENKNIVIVGAGRLVGAPAIVWLLGQGVTPTVVTEETPDNDSAAAMAAADIIITGAGVPHLITPEKIKDGVVLFDAGTSESGGQLAGDVHPDCAEKVTLLTPVPGGIGPLTIACLLQNLITLSRQ